VSQAVGSSGLEEGGKKNGERPVGGATIEPSMNWLKKKSRRGLIREIRKKNTKENSSTGGGRGLFAMGGNWTNRKVVHIKEAVGENVLWGCRTRESKSGKKKIQLEENVANMERGVTGGVASGGRNQKKISTWENCGFSNCKRVHAGSIVGMCGEKDRTGESAKVEGGRENGRVRTKKRCGTEGGKTCRKKEGDVKGNFKCVNQKTRTEEGFFERFDDLQAPGKRG